MLKCERKLTAREFRLGYVEFYGKETDSNHLRIFEDNGTYQLRGILNGVVIRDARYYLNDIRELVKHYQSV